MKLINQKSTIIMAGSNERQDRWNGGKDLFVGLKILSTSKSAD